MWSKGNSRQISCFIYLVRQWSTECFRLLCCSRSMIEKDAFYCSESSNHLYVISFIYRPFMVRIFHLFCSSIFSLSLNCYLVGFEFQFKHSCMYGMNPSMYPLLSKTKLLSSYSETSRLKESTQALEGNRMKVKPIQSMPLNSTLMGFLEIQDLVHQLRIGAWT